MAIEVLTKYSPFKEDPIKKQILDSQATLARVQSSQTLQTIAQGIDQSIVYREKDKNLGTVVDVLQWDSRFLKGHYGDILMQAKRVYVYAQGAGVNIRITSYGPKHSIDLNDLKPGDASAGLMYKYHLKEGGEKIEDMDFAHKLTFASKVAEPTFVF